MCRPGNGHGDEHTDVVHPFHTMGEVDEVEAEVEHLINQEMKEAVLQEHQARTKSEQPAGSSD